jgi:ATP-binding cassette subfamily B protein
MKNSAAPDDFPGPQPQKAEPPSGGPRLAEGEKVIAVFRPDLSSGLRFDEGLVVATQRRVWFRDERGEERELSVADGIDVERRERAGVCELFLRTPSTGARFRYTLARATQAAELAEALARVGVASASGAAEQQVEVSARVEQLSDPDSEVDAARVGSAPLLRLFGFARPRLGKVLLGFGLTLATTAVGLIPPYLTMPLVDEVLVPWQSRAAPGFDATQRTLVLYLGGLGLAAIVAWLLAWAQGAVLAWVSELISADLRNRAFSHLTRLSIHYFGGKRTGDLIARISSETDRLCSFLSDTLIDFVTDVLMIVGTSVVLFSLDPLLALAALVSFPPIAWFMVRVRGSLTHGFLRGGRVWSQMTNILADTIPGIRVVKAFSQERREIRRFEQANQRIVEVNNRVNALWTSFWPLVALLNQVGLLVVWAVGAYQVLHHHITVGVLTAFIAYIGRFYARVESMSRMLTLTQRASAAAHRLFEILDRVPDELPSRGSAALENVKGALEFERVSFRYGSRLVLDDVSFEVEPGQMLGIVGHTGSGKSTVANLVCRFYEASGGVVRLDGVDVRSLSVEEYRRHIGIVLQDSFLFFGTIGENVAYGLPDAEPSAVLAASRAARAHEFVLKLPEAYDALVGERGQSLSGGERQRVAIARAILVDPRILVLDEATSAVDVQTEREIQRALDNVVAGRTTIAIAHRLSTLAKADRLLVLKDGKLVETGTHAELLARGGEYARLQRAQQLSGAAQEVEAVAPEPELASRVVLSAAELALSWSAETDTLSALSGDGEIVVSPRRCFPLSDPERFISLVDAQGRELCCVEAPSQLTPSSRGALVSALAASELLPLVERIERVDERATSSTWHVVTDRGARQFLVEQEDHIRRLADGRHLITDSFGMRYLVPHPERLDAKSRRLITPFS